MISRISDDVDLPVTTYIIVLNLSTTCNLRVSNSARLGEFALSPKHIARMQINSSPCWVQRLFLWTHKSLVFNKLFDQCVRQVKVFHLIRTEFLLCIIILVFTVTTNFQKQTWRVQLISECVPRISRHCQKSCADRFPSLLKCFIYTDINYCKIVFKEKKTVLGHYLRTNQVNVGQSI